MRTMPALAFLGDIRAPTLIGATLMLAAALLPACGGSGGITSTSHTPTRSVISQRGWQLAAGEALLVDLSVSGSGTATVDATVEWTLATNDVDVYVTNTSCTFEMVAATACAYTAKADSTTAKPERLSFSTSSGNYRFWIVNFGPTNESGTLEVGLTQ